MRRILFVLILLAMLPLRGWASDAMAIQMAAQTQATQIAVPSSAPSEHSNCHEMQVDPASAPQTSNTVDPCATCASCQACFTVAIVMPTLESATQSLPHGLPLAASAQFTSAIIALGHKPPIS